MSKTKAVGNLVKDVNVAVCTTEGVLARTKSIDGDISQRVDTLAVVGADGTVDNETIRGILGVDIVVTVLELNGGCTGLLVNLVVLSVVGHGTDTTGDGVSGLPVGGEVGAGAVVDTLGLLGVLRLAGLLVDTNGAALGTIILLLGEVLSVGRTPNTAIVSKLILYIRWGNNLLKTVTVVSRDDDKSLVEDVKLLELLDGSTDSVIKFKKVAESTVVIKSVHLLVDGGSLRHEEEPLVLTTGAEDVNGLESHVLETGQVTSSSLRASGVVLKALDVVGVNVAVEPDRKVALAEDTESTLAVISLEERGLVVRDSVALLLVLLVVVLALVGTLSSNEVLSTATEENIGTLVLGPAVVAVSVEILVDQRTVLASETSVTSKSNGSSVGEVSSRNSTPSTALLKLEYELSSNSEKAYPDTLEDLDNGLDLGVIKGVGRRVGVDTTLVSSSS